MKPADSYLHFVKWSDEDQCYIGYCPDLFCGGVCHGEDEETTYADLSTVVRDKIAHRLAKSEDLPKPTIRATGNIDYAAA